MTLANSAFLARCLAFFAFLLASQGKASTFFKKERQARSDPKFIVHIAEVFKAFSAPNFQKPEHDEQSPCHTGAAAQEARSAPVPAPAPGPASPEVPVMPAIERESFLH